MSTIIIWNRPTTVDELVRTVELIHGREVVRIDHAINAVQGETMSGRRVTVQQIGKEWWISAEVRYLGNWEREVTHHIGGVWSLDTPLCTGCDDLDFEWTEYRSNWGENPMPTVPLLLEVLDVSPLEYNEYLNKRNNLFETFRAKLGEPSIEDEPIGNNMYDSCLMESDYGLTPTGIVAEAFEKAVYKRYDRERLYSSLKDRTPVKVKGETPKSGTKHPAKKKLS